MNILFSFECNWMPIRARVFINFLENRGHFVDILTPINTFEGSTDIKFNKNFTNINLVNLNNYDLWIHDLLNYDKLHEKSEFNLFFEKFKNKLAIINYDDGCSFFEYRLNNPERIDIWINNILYKNKNKYANFISSKCMLVPSYVEDSNRHNLIVEQNNTLIPFKDKKNRVYFTGTLTGGFPCYEHRSNVINEVLNIKMDNIIRIHGSENHAVLKWFYTYIVPNSVKQNMVDYPTFLTEINDSKFVLALKGNGTDPTRRYFESLSFNCLTFLTENNITEYLAQAEENKHYVSIKLDASDVNDKLQYYSDNIIESEKIANAGYDFWKQNCKIFNDGSLNENIKNYLIDNFMRISNIKL